MCHCTQFAGYFSRHCVSQFTPLLAFATVDDMGYLHSVLQQVCESVSSPPLSSLHHRPAGWDSEKKINILSEHMKTINPDAPFDNVIQPPASANVRPFNIMTCHAVGGGHLIDWGLVGRRY